MLSKTHLAFHLHLDFVPIHTARVIHSVLVAMTLFNTWRAVNSLRKFKVNAHSHFDRQSMNRFVAGSQEAATFYLR